MLSLQQLLGKDVKSFALMAASAEAARASILSLIDHVKSPEGTRSLTGFVEARRKSKTVTQELTRHLCGTFVTVFEREDIEALASALYKIPKTAEKFGERLMLTPQHVRGLPLEKQLILLHKAADTLVPMVEELCRGADIEAVKAQNDQLQQIESEADNIMLESLRELYTATHSAVHIVIQKDLFELLEKIFDRCRDAGNVIFQIVLKHS